MLFGYYVQKIHVPHDDAVEIVLKLSDQERLSLKSLQPSFPFIVNGISDPSCVNHSEILESLLQIGITEYSAPIFVLAKFSLPYILNPDRSIGEFLFDLKEEAKSNRFINDILNYSVFKGNYDFEPFSEFLSKFDDSDSVLYVLDYARFKEEPPAFKFFFHELEKIYYHGMEPTSYKHYFSSNDSFRKFLKDLWNAKHGIEPIGFDNIFKFFPDEQRKLLTSLLTSSVDREIIFPTWMDFFNSYFKEHIIDKKRKIQ